VRGLRHHRSTVSWEGEGRVFEEGLRRVEEGVGITDLRHGIPEVDLALECGVSKITID